MAARTFTIFQDTPTDVAPTAATPTTVTTTTTTNRARSLSVCSMTSTTSTVIDLEKENLHPLTGERNGPAALATGKKRKNSIASAKTLAPIEVKKPLEADTEPDAKKRKPLSAGATRKSKTAATPTKKDGKGAATARKPSKRSSRAPSPMPKVDEEGDEPVLSKDVRAMSPQEIDAKCYELTVRPLADVSSAFSQSSPLPWLEEEDEDTEEAKLQFVKEASHEPELRDFFTPASVGYESLESSRSNSQGPATPERKHAHKFTFSSPSPIRLSKMMRSASVPRLDIPSSTRTATA